MGRLTRAIRGFFGKFLTGVEQRNPEILLENAVQDELENLKKLQVAAARTMAYEKMLANDAAGQISLSDSSRDLEKARQSIRQSSYEAEAVGQLGTSETERQIAAAELDIKRLDAERELEMMEVQMGLREPEPIEAAPTEETASPQAEETEEEPRGQ